jgi:lipoprotein-anchoring transpeptidase ErfK/SrfK
MIPMAYGGYPPAPPYAPEAHAGPPPLPVTGGQRKAALSIAREAFGPSVGWRRGGSGGGWGRRAAPPASAAPASAPQAAAPESAPAQAAPGAPATSVLPQQAAISAAPGPADEAAPSGPDPQFRRQEVDYSGPEAAGSVVIDTGQHFLFLVEANGRALRYGVGVGRPGFEWAGEHKVTRKAEWPEWIPPDDMLKRKPDLPTRLAGGPDNPLGARALYLGSTLYRIHGTNDPSTIGHNVSSGCIRMTNDDVTDLYGRVPVGTKVVVR